jgi:hypothetical protein
MKKNIVCVLKQLGIQTKMKVTVRKYKEIEV